MKKITLLTTVALVAITTSIAVLAGPLSRGRYESVEYKVEQEDGRVEIRNYPEILLVSVAMQSGGGSDSKDSSFMRLFRYISGKNESGDKISMTTPVFTTPKASSGNKGEVMSFVVPAEVAKKGAPTATDSGVVISKRAAGKFACYRYSGRWTDAREEGAREKLQAWLKSQGLKAIGGFEKANYDSPFTIPALRRNEILVRIK
jgi:hypothetical protein